MKRGLKFLWFGMSRIMKYCLRPGQFSTHIKTRERIKMKKNESKHHHQQIPKTKNRVFEIQSSQRNVLNDDVNFEHVYNYCLSSKSLYYLVQE